VRNVNDRLDSLEREVRMLLCIVGVLMCFCTLVAWNYFERTVLKTGSTSQRTLVPVDRSRDSESRPVVVAPARSTVP
jgi:hypothetical protein